MFQLALIIPCYNESKRIRPTFEAYIKHFNQTQWSNKKIALVFVDDGSLDDTYSVLKEFEKSSTNNLSIIASGYKENKGKGGAIKYGVSKVDAEVYGFTDADLAYDPRLVDIALEALERNDLVIGRRVNESQVSFYSKMRSFISSVLRKLVHAFISLPSYDTQCGFKLFNKKVATEVIQYVVHDRFSFDIELIQRAINKNFKIKELPINFSNSNESTVTWRDGVRYILDAISIGEKLAVVNFKKMLFTLLGISLLISFSFYGWVIFKGFLFSDDFTWLWHGQKIDSFYDIMTFKMSTFYSPVMNAFYALFVRIFGYNPQILFTINITAHALVAFMSGILSWQISKSRLTAIVVTVLVAFAGVAYEPLVWIGSNMHSFATLFIVSSLVAYYGYLNNKKGGYLILSFSLFVLALGTKESAIVTPALILSLSLYKYLADKQFVDAKLILFWIVSVIVSGVYLLQQYLWQKNSIWVESGVWQLSAIQIFRLPLVLFDNIVPISPLKFYLDNQSASFLLILATTLLVFILYKFRHIKLVWLGLAWAIIGITPFIFFQTQFWWEPLASRYNYLPRIGIIIMLASILHHLIVSNKARHVISGLVFVVIISVFTQLIFTAYIVNAQYGYVYNTGRSLTNAMQEVAILKPDKIFVRWDYPFTGNNAHIVGAASVIANVPEEKIVFLKKGESENLSGNEILLYWDAQSRKYSIRNN